jgi:arylsulfatase A-like enzyme
MTQRLTLVSAVALTAAVGCSTKNKQIESELPNIIYILVDDMGVGDLSMFGQTSFSTPNIDKLAKDGMLFTNHYCGSTVSGPSRACLMTGKHTGNQSVRGNQPTPQVIGDDEVTIAKVLNEKGYSTAVIGKWGIGHPVPLDDPQKKGFDYSYGYLNMWHAHNCFPDFLYRNGQKEMLEGNAQTTNPDGSPRFADMPEGTGVAKPDARKHFTADLFLEDASFFIEVNKNNPFFLYYAMNLPHANNEASPDGMEVPDFGEFTDMDWPRTAKGFAQMMRIIDNHVGAMVAKLEELGIAENTIIMFASDNGAHSEGGHKVEFFNSNGNTRGKKRDFYDGGIRTPFIVKWPKVVKPSSTSDHLSAFWDVLPTFCDIVKAEKPKDIHGISFLSTLEGKQKKQKKHDYLYFEFYEEGGKQAIVSADWKYVKLNVRQGDGQKQTVAELYNLRSDPEEQFNIIDKHPKVVTQMEKYLKEAHTPFPIVSLFEVDGAQTDMSHN